MKFLLLILWLLLMTACGHLFYHPTKIAYFDPKKFVHVVEDVWITADDGTKLNGWWMPTKKDRPKGTVVFFHGNAENLSSHFLHLAWITHEGYNLFIHDYRGYGASEGKPEARLIYKDSFLILDKAFELFKKYSPQGKFIVYGQSLGGIVAMRALNEWSHQDAVHLLVQDSTFHSFQGIAFDKLKSFWPTFLFSPLAYILISDEYASTNFLKKFNRPMLVISGEMDRVVPLKFSQEIFDRVGSGEKWFWKIANGVHGDVFTFHDFKYRTLFLEFLEKL